MQETQEDISDKKLIFFFFFLLFVVEDHSQSLLDTRCHLKASLQLLESNFFSFSWLKVKVLINFTMPLLFMQH